MKEILINLWLNDELVQTQKIEFPYDLTKQTEQGTNNYYIKQCVYCGEIFISRQQKTKHCGNKCMHYAKRVKKAWKKIKNDPDIQLSSRYKFIQDEDKFILVTAKDYYRRKKSIKKEKVRK